MTEESFNVRGKQFEIDPRILRLPPSRSDGADPAKLQRQIARHANSTDDMPEIWVYRCTDDELVIYNGVTRATRVAKLSPGQNGPGPGDRSPVGPRGISTDCSGAIAMTSSIRQELLGLLAELSEACPDVRLGQLLTNLSYKSRGLSNDAAWEVEDAELISAAKAHLTELESSTAASTTTEATP